MTKNIYPTISRLTRVMKNSATLIDNLFISENLIDNYRSGILINDMSDHLPCLLTIQNSEQDTKGHNMIITCDLNDTKLTNIRQDLSKVNWHETLHHDNCQDNYTVLDRTLTIVLDIHAPPKLNGNMSQIRVNLGSHQV